MPNGVKRQGRSSDQRTKLLHILEYLLENTDENHFVKNADIKRIYLTVALTQINERLYQI